MKFGDRLAKVLFEQDQVNPATQPTAASQANTKSVTPVPALGEQKPVENVSDTAEDEKLDQYVTKQELQLMLQNYPTTAQLEEMFVTQEILNASIANFVTRDEWKEAFDDLLG